jgi:hypothetical protein
MKLKLSGKSGFGFISLTQAPTLHEVQEEIHQFSQNQIFIEGSGT